MPDMLLAIQNYTLRHLMEEDFFGTLKAVRDLGIEYCELAGTGKYSAAEVREGLEKIGMRAIGAHVGFDPDNTDVEKAVSDAKILGYHYIVCPWVSQDKIAKGWEYLGRAFEQIAQGIAAKGLQFAYHNHDFEFKADPKGRIGMEVFYENADPGLVQAELDLCWVQHGGQDPVAWLKKMHARVPLVHLKDLCPTASHPDCAPGDGILDWDAILPACEAAGVEYGVIEIDQPENGLEDVERAVKFLRTKGY